MTKKALTLLLLSCGALYANAEVKYMTVEQKTGEKYGFLLEDNPIITYSDGNLVVNGNAETSYAISSVKDYHFTEKDETATCLERIDANELRILNIDKRTIRVENAPASAPIQIVGANGIVWMATTTDKAGTATIQLPLQKGVYILSVGKQSLKLIRK